MCTEISDNLYIKYFYKKVQAKVYKKLDFFNTFLYNTLALILKAYILIYNFIFNMINIKKQWFTLVELIVVITILAILWSIAFISLQGYSSDARNSKRVSDLGSLQSSLTVKQTSGSDLMAFAITKPENTLGTISVGWQTPTGKYIAWIPNYSALGMKSTDFQDPQSSDYRIWVSSLAGWVYQIAASMEQSGWSKIAKVVWSYSPRTTAIATAAVSTWSTSVILTNVADINKIKALDVVSLTRGGASTWTVLRISNDGMTLTLSTWSTTATTVTLFANETAGLIASGATNPVVDGLSTYLPY
jgi:prepilin-type N-terminal cleavage/methylation domain-containing protein